MDNAEASLRVELDLARELLEAAHRENDLLRNLLSQRARSSAAERPTLPAIGSRERMARLEHVVDVLDAFAQRAASYDCYGCDGTDPGCWPCRAEAALKAAGEWRFSPSREAPTRRFVGSFYARTQNGWWPREEKIHRAWASFMESHNADRTLGHILTENRGGPIDWPTPRDWYVATSVVQWLVTNVGSSILEAAGWKYTQWDEDRVLERDRQAAYDAERAAERKANQSITTTGGT